MQRIFTAPVLFKCGDLFGKEIYSCHKLFHGRSLSIQVNSTAKDTTEKVENWSTQHAYKSLYPWKSKEDLSTYLCQNILYAADGLIVFNKPYGVGVATAVKKTSNKLHTMINSAASQLHFKGLETAPYTLQDMLPYLSKELRMPNLLLLKSAEKFASGIAIFADGERPAQRYAAALARTKPQPLFNHLIISTSIPLVPKGGLEERVGITMKSSPTSDVKQPLIQRNFSKNAMESGNVKPVRTKVSIQTTSNLNTSLLFICTSSVKWNFLRVYCADLLAPILGDELYSSRVQSIKGIPTKIHPIHLIPGASRQKISTEVLTALQLKRPEDSVIIPTHVHLRSIVLKHFPNKSKSLQVDAPIPSHFRWTCDKLNLNIPDL